MVKKTAIKEKYAGPKGPMKIETPPPTKEIKLDEIKYLGNKLADLSERVNELELSLEQIRLKVNTVSGRMGL
jgi:hypothetical protein|tara:strand:- start:439 stop:654 length:216 start_codon:yes stop_codon:yes gene_type:complete